MSETNKTKEQIKNLLTTLSFTEAMLLRALINKRAVEVVSNREHLKVFINAIAKGEVKIEDKTRIGSKQFAPGDEEKAVRSIKKILIDTETEITTLDNLLTKFNPFFELFENFSISKDSELNEMFNEFGLNYDDFE